jgi:hypothetical protein
LTDTVFFALVPAAVTVTAAGSTTKKAVSVKR